MHARVGAPGARDLDRMSERPLEGTRDRAGDGVDTSLQREPVEPAAVVSDEEPYAKRRP